MDGQKGMQINKGLLVSNTSRAASSARLFYACNKSPNIRVKQCKTQTSGSIYRVSGEMTFIDIATITR